MLFRKLTEERSGSFSAASPPPASSAGSASAQVVVTNSKVARARDALAIPRLADAKWAVQVRITILLRISIQGSQRVLLLRLFGCSQAFPFAAQTAATRVPTTLPPQDVKNLRSADLAASEHLVPPYTP